VLKFLFSLPWQKGSVFGKFESLNDDTFKLHNLENPCLVQNVLLYRLYQGVLGNFMLNIPNFRYYGNKGRSSVIQNLNVQP